MSNQKLVDVLRILGEELAVPIAATGQVVNFGTPSAFAAAIEEQRAKAAAVAALGLKPGR